MLGWRDGNEVLGGFWWEFACLSFFFPDPGLSDESCLCCTIGRFLQFSLSIMPDTNMLRFRRSAWEGKTICYRLVLYDPTTFSPPKYIYELLTGQPYSCNVVLCSWRSLRRSTHSTTYSYVQNPSHCTQAMQSFLYELQISKMTHLCSASMFHVVVLCQVFKHSLFTHWNFPGMRRLGMFSRISLQAFKNSLDVPSVLTLDAQSATEYCIWPFSSDAKNEDTAQIIKVNNESKNIDIASKLAAQANLE